MSANSSDFKLGLFVVVGILLLLGGIFIFSASRLFEAKTVEETYTTGNVEGLQVGAPVLLRGVRVGNVTDINFSWNLYHVSQPRYVVIRFEVNDSVALVPPGKDFIALVEAEVKKGLRARVKSQGLAGAPILSLEYLDPAEYPPLQVPWTPRHIYIPSATNQFSEMFSALDKTLHNLTRLDFERLGGTLQQDLAAAEKLLNHLDEANLGGVGTNANALLVDLRGLSARMQSFIGESNAPGREVNLQMISGNADQVLAQLQRTAHQLDHIVENLDATSLNESLENVRRASQDLEQALRQLKQYPAGVLLGEPPPPAKSVERSHKQ
jgi:ABC-type transporter Mla subunit MlaD